MNNALVFLLVQSWKNRFQRRLQRLKNPKYLVTAVFGAVYFGYFFFWRVIFGVGRDRLGAGGDGPDPVLLESMRALMLFVVVLLAWIVPHKRAALVFSEAEIAFLFPAPVPRRTLIHFKLVRSQIPILFTSLLFAGVFGWTRGGPMFARVIGWWLIFSMLNLHFLGSSFARTLLLEHGISNWKRRILVLTFVAVLAGGVALWAWRSLPPPPSTADINGVDDLKYYFESVLASGPLVWLLWPFRIVVRPYLAPDAAAFFQALWLPLLLLGLHYLWVVRSNVAFEEASIESSRKMADWVAARRAGRAQAPASSKKSKRAPFKLSPVGPPAIALLWKNLIGAGTGFTLRFWLIWIWIAVVVGFSVGHRPGGFSLAVLLAPILLTFLGLSFLMGPQMVRQDFRQELPMADLLKTYPLPSWQLALGELLAPLVILTGLQWCLILLAVLIFPPGLEAQMIPGMRWSIALAVAMLAPGINLVSLIIPNAVVLLFPGWFQTGRDAPQGVEAMGQRLIFTIGQLVVLLLAFVPAAAVFVILIFAGQLLGGPVAAIPLAGAAAAFVLAAEGSLGVWFLGKLFDRFDVSSETVPG